MKARYNIIIATVLTLFLSAGKIFAQELPAKDSTIKDNALSYFIKAQGEYLLGNVDSAAVNIEKSLALDKSNDAAWFLKSKIAYDKKDFYDHFKSLSSAYTLDSDNPDYALAYATALLNNKDAGKAIVVLEGAAEKNPKNEDIVSTLAQVYMMTNNFEKGEKIAQNFKETVGGYMGYYILYRVYDAAQNNTKALATLLEADAQMPSVPWKELIAEQYLKTANDSLAEVYYNKILAEDPDSKSALYGRMELDRTNGKMESFFDSFNKYLALDDITNDRKLNYIQDLLKSPLFFNDNTDEFAESLNKFYNKYQRDTAVGYLAAQFDMYAKKEKEAYDILNNLNEIYPSDKGVATNVIAINYTLKNWAELKAFTQKHLKANDIEGFTEDLLKAQGTAEYFMKDYGGAIETSKKLLEYAQKINDTELIADTYATLGDMSHEAGKKKDCYKYYKKALSINPEHCPVLNNYAWYLATDPKNKDYSKAQQMSKITILKEPGNSTYLDTYAYILYKSGDLSEARKYYQQAIAYGTDLSSTIYMHYAQCLYALGEYDLARSNYIAAFNKAVEENNLENMDKLEKEMAERNDKLKILQDTKQ